jgi:hypothetical protein
VATHGNGFGCPSRSPSLLDLRLIATGNARNVKPSYPTRYRDGALPG